MTQLITAKTIAEKIKRPGESLQAAVDRLRHYAREGLVEPAGEKNPGTGRKRLYPQSALLDCLILELLTDAVGIPVAKTKKVLDDIKSDVSRLSHKARKGWFLVVCKSVGKDDWWVTPTNIDKLDVILDRDDYDTYTILRLDRVLAQLKPEG